MASNLGKFFSGIKNKKKVNKTKTSSGTLQSMPSADDSEEDGYEDPAEAWSEPPAGIGIPVYPVPSYPPPRIDNTVIKRHDDYANPYDTKENGVLSPQVTLQDPNYNNYADPFDAKFSDSSSTQLNNETKISNGDTSEEDGYDSPYEGTKGFNKSDINKDDYAHPWDIKTSSNTELHSREIPSKNETNVIRNYTKHDEYSDPWDAKNSSSPKSQDASFDDTYSEPYDKGKSTILVEKKHIVDESGEDEMGEFSDKEKRWILSTDSHDNVDSINSIQCKKSNTANIANASQGDYDAPWDWKVKAIEKDFDKIGRNGTQATEKNENNVKDESVNPLNSSISNSVKKVVAERTSVSSDDSESKLKVYQVDPTIPLQNQGWFHGRIRRGDAEKLLKSDPDCSYLIRNSESSKIDYSLSIRNNGATIHLKISCRDGKYILGVNSRPFDTIPEMIHYYSMNKLNIRGAEQVKLQYPVLQEAVYFTVVPGT